MARELGVNQWQRLQGGWVRFNGACIEHSWFGLSQ